MKGNPEELVRLSDLERCTLAENGKRLGRKALACVAKPDTILALHQRLTARKFDWFAIP